jgi:hypothetical protein
VLGQVWLFMLEMEVAQDWKAGSIQARVCAEGDGFIL